MMEPILVIPLEKAWSKSAESSGGKARWKEHEKAPEMEVKQAPTGNLPATVEPTKEQPQDLIEKVARAEVNRREFMKHAGSAVAHVAAHKLMPHLPEVKPEVIPPLPPVPRHLSAGYNALMDMLDEFDSGSEDSVEEPVHFAMNELFQQLAHHYDEMSPKGKMAMHEMARHFMYGQPYPGMHWEFANAINSVGLGKPDKNDKTGEVLKKLWSGDTIGDLAAEDLYHKLNQEGKVPDIMTSEDVPFGHPTLDDFKKREKEEYAKLQEAAKKYPNKTLYDLNPKYYDTAREEGEFLQKRALGRIK